MVPREFWFGSVEEAWRRRNLIWLAGVRRAGKTFLCRSIPEIEYFDCELPRTRRQMEEDPELFLKSLGGRRVALDEVHRLRNPTELLKICTDHFPDVQMIATGSSTLQASSKFKDSLTGRKTRLWLTPMILQDLEDFGRIPLDARLLRGGLPPFLQSSEVVESEFQEWIDSYWSKDVQELFRVERRHGFQQLLEMLLAQSGGIFEATRFSRACEISRTTVSNYLTLLEETFVVYVIRPFSTHRPTEIISAPKVYGFDTGFVCYFRGWQRIRREDRGYLWEHFVLNEIQARLQTRQIRYWRNKRGKEIDFVWARRTDHPVVIECKWSADAFHPAAIKSFRRLYPKGQNFVVCHDVERPYDRRFGEIEVRFSSLEDLIAALQSGK